ncbi:MAG TPA: hypothetical protein VFG68_19525 [Fimbriiglobus sp.]|nr:hypothetical protein [Fimbriiglobus sp.]
MPDHHFPWLTAANSRITSPADHRYNCLAWAANDSTHWWQPGPKFHWPTPADPDADRIEDLIAAFAAVGFVPCGPGDLEPGFERIALYADAAGRYTHAARQLPTGTWTSKLGIAEDIEHDTPDNIAGGIYGDVFGFMRRPVSTAT